MPSEAKHTPGPWHAWRNTSYWQIDAEEFGQIGDACASSANPKHGGSEALGRANALLMAAAPDLYEALKALHDDCIEYSRINNLGGEDNQVLVRARAALAKAAASPTDKEGGEANGTPHDVGAEGK